jgi:signal transduction histidine kinase
LASISGYAQLIKLKSERREYVHRNVDLILQTTERGKELVEHILTFSRRRPQEKSVFPLHLIVKESLRILEHSLPENIAVERDIIARDDFVQADPSQMHELCMNLYTNAVQAMQEQGGRLRVTLSRLEDCIRALPVEASSCLYLAVEDTGAGMDEDTLNRIFEPFFTTRSPHGSGLGLSVVHGIVTEAGGTVRVQSKPAEGSRFEVYLPAVASADASWPTDEGTST